MRVLVYSPDDTFDRPQAVHLASQHLPVRFGDTVLVRNPRFYVATERPKTGIDAVLVSPDYPELAADYARDGVQVILLTPASTPQPHAEPPIVDPTPPTLEPLPPDAPPDPPPAPSPADKLKRKR